VIRRDIRDKFDSANSAVQQKQKSLKDVIGYAVDCVVDWAMLWTECASHFEDKSTFVPYITSAITAFCDDLMTKLEDEDSPWTEQLLEKIEQAQAVKMIVQVWLQSVHRLQRRQLTEPDRKEPGGLCTILR
jgi:hypothetical protein